MTGSSGRRRRAREGLREPAEPAGDPKLSVIMPVQNVENHAG